MSGPGRFWHPVAISIILITSLEARASFLRTGDFEYDCNYAWGRLTATVLRYLGESPHVTVPATVTYKGNVYPIESIGDEFWQPFRDNQVVEHVALPSCATSIGPEAFSGCRTLRSVDLGHNMRYVSQYAFYDCPALESVTSLTNISEYGRYAFAECTSMTHFSLGSATTSLDVGVFDGTPLTRLTVNAHLPPRCLGALSSVQSFYADCELVVRIGCGEAYLNAAEWSRFAHITEQAQPGDINKDGSVDVKDINILINCVLGRLAHLDVTNADLNGDSKIDILDLNLLLNFVLQN